MCGGGGGRSASQDALAQEQNLQMQRSNARQQNEDLARQRAIAQINQLYGIDSQVDGTEVEEVSYTPPQTAKSKQPAAGTPQFVSKRFSQMYDGSAQRASRESGYDSVRQNALAVALDSLSKQREDAGRNVRFNVARSGLTGGSVDVDENQNLANRYSEGVIQANANADGIVNNVRSKDEATRADLISRINAGMDANSASQAALAQIQNNQNIAKVDGQSNLLSNFFNGIASGIGGYQYGYGLGTGGLDPNKAVGGTVYNATSSNGRLT